MPIDEPGNKPSLRVITGGKALPRTFKLRGRRGRKKRPRGLPACPVVREEPVAAPIASDPLRDALAAIETVPLLSNIWLSVLAENVRYANRCRAVPSDEAGPLLVAGGGRPRHARRRRDRSG